MKLWRHIHTAAGGGKGSGAGFQTVARAEGLADSESRALDRLAGQLMRCHANAPGHSLFLQDATDPDRCVLTRVNALKKRFDRRPGNHWVESQVVPMAWLRDLGWNLPAAFDALDWWGAERGQEEVDSWGGPPALLPEEALPTAEPGSRRLPGRLVELVPDPDLRRGILAAYARQAGAAGPSGETLYVGAPDEDELEMLGELLLLLPMAFPPAWRTRVDPDTGRRRCLQVAGLGAPGHLPNQDLMGLKPSVLDQLRSQYEVFDLSGNVPPPSIAEGEPGEIARRVDEAINDEGGEGLTALHRSLAPSQHPEERSTSMTHDDETFDPGPDLPTPATEGATTGRERTERQWAKREVDEAAAGGGMREVMGQQAGLVEDLRTVLRRHKEHLNKEADQLYNELEDKAAELREKLAESTRQLKSEQQNAFLNEEKELKDRIGTWVGRTKKDRERLSEDLHREHEAAMEMLNERFDQAKAALESRREEMLDELSREGGLPPAKKTRKKGKKGSPTAGLFSRLRRRPVLIALLAALSLVAAGVIGWTVLGFELGFGFGGTEEETGNPADVGGADEGDGGDDSTDPITLGLSDARRLLAAAMAREDPAIRNRAAQAWLLVAMDGADPRTLDESASCALTQTLVRELQLRVGLSPLSVDGDCGPGTASAVRDVAGAECRSGTWTGEAACLWTRTLTPGREECEATWPLRLACEWRIGSAEEFLALVRESATLSGQAGLRRSYDLLAGGDLIQQLDAFDAADRNDLLPLARILAFSEQGDADPDTTWRMPSDAERETIEAYLNNLPADPEPETGGADAAPGATTS